MSLPFPNVPVFPGVPQVPRSSAQAVSQVAALASNIITSLLGSAPAQTQWGIFLNGTQVVTPDSVTEFDSSNSWDVSNFPVQAGAFASYNKVIVPYEIQVRMTKGGTQVDRTNFLTQIAAIAGNTTLYDIWTPEYIYFDANVTRYEYQRRSAAGAFFLDVDIFFIQIVQVNPQYTSTTLNAIDPTAQPAANQGSLQPVTVDQQTLSAVAPAISF